MQKTQNKLDIAKARPVNLATAKAVQAFTLVELIVVITILAILGTIAFISLQWYSAQSRDAKRVSDISNIKKSLELFSLNTWKYPLPDNGEEYSFSWDLLRTQWIVWDQVTTNLSRNLNEKPLDPSQDIEYVYSVTNVQTQYELLWNFETNDLTKIDLLKWVNATNYIPKISGTYNWVYVKTSNFIFPTPSIINALNLETDFNTNSWAIQSQIVTWWDNNINWWTWALLDLTMTYTWVITNDSSDAAKISVIDMLQSFYSVTSLANIDEIADLLSKTTDDDKKGFAEFLILNSWVVNVSSWSSSQTTWWWNDEYTVFLLQSEDTNWATTFSDSSIWYTEEHTVSAYWQLQHSNTVSKFWNSSMRFDWDSDYFIIPDSEDWNFADGDFTIDFWLLSGNNIRQMIFNQWIGNNHDWVVQSFALDLDRNTQPIFAYKTTTADRTDVRPNPTTYGITIFNWNWHHYVYERKGTKLNFYIDWVLLVDVDIWTSSINNSPYNLLIWAYSHSNYNWCNIAWYIEEFRISKWIARTADINDQLYITNTCENVWDTCFEVPTEAY